MYVFEHRRDLDIDVAFSVRGNKSTAVSGAASSATFTVEQRNVTTQWWGNSNSLRRVRGMIRFNYSDLHGLGEAGTHRANIDVCMQVRGHL